MGALRKKLRCQEEEHQGQAEHFEKEKVLRRGRGRKGES